MLDYNYVLTSGDRVPVAKLPTQLIQELLRVGVRIHNPEDPSDAERVMKRLDLELFIRRHNLRG